MDPKIAPTHRQLSPLASMVITEFEKQDIQNNEQKINVNPVVSKVASWYEKLRNAMEYREDEVILRAAIERNLRRHLLLGGNAQTTAEPLVRELIWARYLEDDEVPESTIDRVEDSIRAFLELRLAILAKHKFPQAVLDEWTYQLMSSDIEKIVNPNIEKETMSNFMFHILKDHVKLVDDSEETKNAQVYIAVRRAFARDDTAFLRYNLFTQFFDRLTPENADQVAEDFPKGYKEIEKELSFKRRDRIYSYVKKRTAAFFILEDVLRLNRGGDRQLVENPEALSQAVFAACDVRYKSIAGKVRRAIIRSVVFILLTKVIFAFAVEGTYERIVYGRILWGSIILNTSMPPLIMIIVSFFIRTPGEDNSNRILNMIKVVLFEDQPRVGHVLSLTRKPDGKRPFLNGVFTVLWFLAFFISFGSVSYLLTRLGFNFVSQGIFIVFLAIVSFLAYRINLTANLYTLGDKQSYFTPVVDFLFMPVVRVGRRLTQSISQLNFLLFIFDFIIETPFKAIFAFAERWFRFLHEKREEIG